MNIDYKKHMSFSKTAEKGLKERLSSKFSLLQREQLWERLVGKYEAFLEDQPYCGGKSNPMIWQLYDAIACFAYWEVLPEKESVEEFAETCNLAFGIKPGKSLPKILTVDNQKFADAVAGIFRLLGNKFDRELESGRWQDGWRIEVDKNHVPEGTQVALIGCPIYNFAKRNGYEFLMPAMCNGDFPGIDMIHAGLIRSQTVSNGNDRCDNWYVSMDSSFLKKYPPERKESGLLISKDWYSDSFQC